MFNARSLLRSFVCSRKQHPAPPRDASRWQGLEPLEARQLMHAIAFADDPALFWSDVALHAALTDTQAASAAQPGPTFTSRALAMAHVAVFDAYNAVHREYESIASDRRARRASPEAAIAQAAHDTLASLYPDQRAIFDARLNESLAAVPDGRAERRGQRIGQKIANDILKWRSADGSQSTVPYTPENTPGAHQPDPMNPDQGFHAPHWGVVAPFGREDKYQMLIPFSPLTSDEYAAAYEEVRVLGALDAEVSDRNNDGLPDRTDEQTEIGIFWGYDHRLGTPPRLYLLAAHLIAEQMNTTVGESARLMALVSIAMADAGCVAWDMKYTYNIWRPVVAIREGDTDGNPLTVGEPGWTPLGAPANFGDPAGFPGAPGPDADPDPVGGPDFTPPFPAFTSGHATFGAAAFRSIANFFGTDEIAFDLFSEDSGTIRSFTRLSQASEENGRSRIYLGIHWDQDDVIGRFTGNAVADQVFNNVAREKA